MSTVVTGYTRQETAALCDVNPSRLSYLDRLGVVSPQKFGNPKKPSCFYSFKQLLELKAIFKMRSEVSLQTIRKMIDFLEEWGEDKTLHDKEIIVFGEDVYWLTEENSKKVLIQFDKSINSKQYGILEVILIPSLNTLKGELIEMANSSPKMKRLNILERIPA
ncbi:MerR family transcriptional regulator [Laspinema olomoucense]|uniref:MerR family transcriptional regulator n=1 Tax=Laspinema olomoucense D3b TaxID=2953688 RepID=A0ABT2NFY2_9CYAN|nr:MerR family transcriptional regulator [Laspinema sp. D3b]MCT7981597.1 MerR family transcriptional regulator [Laspinema sp. D3b]